MIKEAKEKGENRQIDKDHRAAWRLFNKIMFQVDSNEEIPGKVVKYLLYRE